jgi:ubiquinone/menaquinone biosynthesis C-methylase UbiE
MTTYKLSTEAAEFYESTFVPALFGEWAARLVEFAGLTPGTSLVLDVGCGTGAVARAAADAVGPGGVVAGLDLNEAMLTVARRLRPDLDWRHGDAAALPFDDASFDAVLSQAALMFFPDRVGALREMGRVARPDGRVAVQVPGRLSHSPGYLALAEVAARHAGAEVAELLGSYFAVGDPDRLTGLMEEAGLTVTTARPWLSATRLGSVDAFLDVELLPVAGRVDPEVRARIAADCRVALAPFTSAGGAVAAPIEVVLAAARAPA